MNPTNSTSLLNSTRILINHYSLQSVGDLELLQEQYKLEEIQNQIDQSDNVDLINQKTVEAIEILTQTIIPAISRSSSNEGTKNAFKSYNSLKKLYSNNLAELNKKVPVQDISPKKSKSSIESQHHLLDKHTLSEKICLFTLEPSKFFYVLNQLITLNDPSLASILPDIKFPEELCLEKTLTPLSDYDLRVLSAKDPLFLEMNTLISKITSKKLNKACLTETVPLLKKIAAIYKEYREELCQCTGEKRRSLLVGKARLYIKEECLLLEQERARQIVCFNQYGDIVSKNAFGAGAVAQIDDVFFKSRKGNPIKPGEEFAVHALYELISNKRGLCTTQLVKIQNIWIKKPLTDNPEKEKKLILLCNNIITNIENRFLPQGVIIEKAFNENPKFEQEYPFLRTRMTRLATASSAIKGMTLHECLESKQSYFADPENFTSMCVLGLLTLASDGRSDNFIVSPYKDTNKIIGIDNDNVFNAGIISYGGKHALNFRYTLYLLPQMDTLLHKDFVRNFLEQDPMDIFLSFLSILKKKEHEDEALLSKKILSKQEYSDVCLPLTLTPEAAIALFRRIKKIHTYINDNQNITHAQLLKGVFPDVGETYESLLKKTNGNILEAEKWLFDQRMRPIELEDWVDNPALISSGDLDLLCWKQSFQKLNGCVQKSLAEIPYFLNNKEQYRWMEKIFLHFPEHENLVLKNCLLKNEELLRLLRTHNKLKVLSLHDCACLTERGIIAILDEYPSLHLVIGKCPKLSPEAIIKIHTLCQSKQHKLSFWVNNKELLLNQGLYQQHLTSCLEQGNLEYAQICIELGAKVDFVENKITLLHRFAEKNCRGVLSFLLEKKLDPNAINSSKQMPLHLAAQAGLKENIEILLKHPIQINAQDSAKHTSIFLAALRGHLAVVRLLVDADANILICAEAKESILHATAAHGQLHVLKFLLSLPQAKQLINAKDEDGKTALHRAVFGNADSDIVKLLLENGFDPNSENNFQYIPLHFAAKEGRKESTRILLEAGSNTSLYNFNGHSPFDLAILNGHDEVAFLFLGHNKRLTKISNALPNDLESHYQKCMRLAKRENNWFEQIFYLCKMSGIHIKGNNFLQAAKLVNGALAITENRDGFAFRKYLLTYLERIEGLFLLNSANVKTPAEFRNYIEKHREELKKARLEGSKLGQDTPQVAASKFTHLINDLFSTFVNEALSLFGTPPCDYALLSLGTMAAEEMSLNSGFDFMILISEENEECRKYFTNLCQLIELKVVNMGETELFSSEEKLSNQTLPGFCLHHTSRHLNQHKVAQLIETPGKMAAFQSCSLQTVALVNGSQKLLDTYRKELKAAMNRQVNDTSQRTLLATRLLGELIKKIVIRFAEAKQEADPQILGEELYSSIQGIIEALALFFEVKANNTNSRIEELKKKKIFSIKGAEDLKEIVQLALKLRSNQKQADPLIKFYQVFLPFFNCVKQFYTTKQARAFKDNIFFEENPIISGKILEINQQYIQAQEQYQNLPSIESNPDALLALGMIQMKLGNIEGALKSCMDGFDISKNIYTKNHPYTAAFCHAIARIHAHTGDNNQALEWSQNELAISQCIFGESHLDISDIYEKMAGYYASLSEHTKAIDCYEKSLKLKVEAYGQNHPGLDRIYIATSDHYCGLKKYEKAMEQIKKALQNKLFTHHEHHPDLIPLYDKCSELYCITKNYPMALEMCRKSWDIYIQEGFKDFSELVPLALKHIQLSQIHQQLKNFQSALMHAEKAFFILYDLSDKNNSDIEISLQEICNCVQEYPDISKDSLDKILNHALSLFGDQHPLVIRLEKQVVLNQKKSTAASLQTTAIQLPLNESSVIPPSEFSKKSMQIPLGNPKGTAIIETPLKLLSSIRSSRLDEFTISGSIFRLQKTAGGGACGLHAALGIFTGKGFFWKNTHEGAKGQFAKDFKEVSEKGSLDNKLLAAERLKNIQANYNKVIMALLNENARGEFSINYNIFISFLSDQQQTSIADYNALKKMNGDERKVLERKRANALAALCKEIISEGSNEMAEALRDIFGLDKDSTYPEGTNWSKKCLERVTALCNYFEISPLLDRENWKKWKLLEESKEKMETNDNKQAAVSIEKLSCLSAYLTAIQHPSYWFTDDEMALIAHIYHINLKIYSLTQEEDQPTLQPGNFQVGSDETRVIFLERNADGTGTHYWRCTEKK